MATEPTPDRELWRLREFIGQHLEGKCRILSIGDFCHCPRCDLDRVYEALLWYGEQATAMARYLKDPNTVAGTIAVAHALSNDKGSRAALMGVPRELMGPE
jgi:hypothetical protein